MTTPVARSDLRAHQESVTLPDAQIVSRLREMLGATLVAYLGEVKKPVRLHSGPLVNVNPRPR